MKNATIVFDLDGTLVDTAPDLVAAANHALADLGLPPVPAQTLRRAIGFGARHTIVEALREHGRAVDDAEVERLLGLFLAYYEPNLARESRPFEGTVAALEGLKAAGARLAVCTNKRTGLSESLLAGLGLTPLFAAVAGSDAFAVHKPHPDHLIGTITRAGGSPLRAVMVGDTAVDVRTARAAGIPVIGCTFGYSDVPITSLAPDAIIGAFSELEFAVAALLGKSATAVQP